MTPAARERRILDLLAPRLKADGYAVYLHPLPQLLPHFMRGYRPDAIALGSTENRPRNIAIEIVGDGRSGHPKAAALTERFADAPDWELRLVYAAESSDDRPVPGASRPEIAAAFARVEDLLDARQPEAALLLGWSLLEATGRLLLPGDLSRPQPAGQLLERMAAEGLVTPDEADRLRPLAVLRNEVAHGALAVAVDAARVRDLLAILRDALAETAAQPV